MYLMPPEPLSPFTGLPFALSMSSNALIGWVLVTAFAFWGLYTIIGIYHWVKFSHAASVAYPAIVIHLAVSGAIMLVALSGLIV
jgi:multidrug resistance efflux pump